MTFSVRHKGRKTWPNSATLASSESFHFLEGGHICAFLWRYFIDFAFVSFNLCVPQIFCVNLSFFRAFVLRVLQDNWRLLYNLMNFASSHRTIDEERKWLEEEWWRTNRLRRPVSYRTDSTQMISHFDIFALSRDMFYRHILQAQGWQLGMASLRPIVGETWWQSLRSPLLKGRYLESEAEAPITGMPTPRCESPTKSRSGRVFETAEGNSTTR